MTASHQQILGWTNEIDYDDYVVANKWNND